MSAMPQWTVYTRAECSLCEQLLQELAELLGPGRGRHGRSRRYRPSDPELERRYGSRSRSCWPTATSSVPTGWTATGSTRCLDRRLSRRRCIVAARVRQACFRYNPPPPRQPPIRRRSTPSDEADPQFLDHRARRSRQIHARRPLHPALRRPGGARDGGPGARLHGAGARARHHDQGAERVAALSCRATARRTSST